LVIENSDILRLFLRDELPFVLQMLDLKPLQMQQILARGLLLRPDSILGLFQKRFVIRGLSRFAIVERPFDTARHGHILMRILHLCFGTCFSSGTWRKSTPLTASHSAGVATAPEAQSLKFSQLRHSASHWRTPSVTGSSGPKAVLAPTKYCC